MTSTALSIFDPANVPDHIVKFNETAANIGDKSTINALTYKGKVWTVSLSGNKQPLMKKNEDGDEEPRTTIPIVILDYNKRRGRSYYSKGFEDDKPAQPDCWSADGITPDKTSAAIQADKCANCPMSVKGSKTTDSGKPTTACQQYRMVAVQLYKKWDMPALRLRLAITSDYDAQNKSNEAAGWYAFQQLIDLLRARGVKHTASMIVRARFDAATAYPKVIFSPAGWTTQDEIDILSPKAESEEVKALLSPTFTPNGADGVRTETPPTDEEPDEAGPVVAAPKPGKSKPKPAVEEDPEEVEGEVVEAPAGDDAIEVGDETEVEEVVTQAEADEDDPEAAARKAADAARAAALARQQAKATAAAAQRKAAASEDDDEIVISTQAPAAKAPATAKAPAAKAPATAKAPAGTLSYKELEAKAHAAPAAAKANGAKAPAAAPAVAKPTAKPPTPAAAKPKAVSPAVGAMLQDWQDD